MLSVGCCFRPREGQGGSYLLVQQVGPYLGGNEMSSSYSLSLKTDSSLSNSKS